MVRQISLLKDYSKNIYFKNIYSKNIYSKNLLIIDM